MPAPVHPARVRPLNSYESAPGDYVLYWMQQSQRALGNHALEYAVELANKLGRPLVVGFGLMDDYPEANLRHYVFMLEGLRETALALAKRGIGFVLRNGSPARVALELAQRACLVVCDRGYLRQQRAWRRQVAAEAKCRVVEVESDVIVPVEITSQKAEFSARTLRLKIQSQLADYLQELVPVDVQHHADGLKVPPSLELCDPEALARSLKLDHSVMPVTRFFRGGTNAAEQLFQAFLGEGLRSYTAHRNQPQTNDVSHMSMYLHFGQISPSWLALEARKHAAEAGDDVATFIEELLVRRELAINFVHFNQHYDRYENLPEWARRTLDDHRRDKRPHLYSREQLEAAETHDLYWNAAMREMRDTGYMHNYMRMYWGKKILEWTATPEEAFATALAINNRYFLDGCDANSFANIAWIFGQHDRPWTERPVFGKVRYMNARGLERKCDIAAYVAKVEELV